MIINFYRRIHKGNGYLLSTKNNEENLKTYIFSEAFADHFLQVGASDASW